MANLFGSSAMARVPPIRFQVSLPTPLAPVHSFIVRENGAEIEQAYEAQLLREIDGILARISIFSVN
jgi:hypothetical protein